MTQGSDQRDRAREPGKGPWAGARAGPHPLLLLTLHDTHTHTAPPRVHWGHEEPLVGLVAVGFH